MLHGLFRRAALEQQSARLDGAVIIAQPVSITLLLAALLVVVSALLIFLVQASFDRKETVAGYLKPSLGLAKITAPRAGVVSAVYITDGQQVQAGDPLLKISLQEQLAEGQSLTLSLSAGFDQQTRLVQQRQQQYQQHFQQQQTELTQRLLSSQQLLREITHQQQMLQKKAGTESTTLQRLSGAAAARGGLP